MALTKLERLREERIRNCVKNTVFIDGNCLESMQVLVSDMGQDSRSCHRLEQSAVNEVSYRARKHKQPWGLRVYIFCADGTNDYVRYADYPNPSDLHAKFGDIADKCRQFVSKQIGLANSSHYVSHGWVMPTDSTVDLDDLHEVVMARFENNACFHPLTVLVNQAIRRGKIK